MSIAIENLPQIDSKQLVYLTAEEADAINGGSVRGVLIGTGVAIGVVAAIAFAPEAAVVAVGAFATRAVASVATRVIVAAVGAAARHNPMSVANTISTAPQTISKAVDFYHSHTSHK